jgi:hypothetical protein
MKTSIWNLSIAVFCASSCCWGQSNAKSCTIIWGPINNAANPPIIQIVLPSAPTAVGPKLLLGAGLQQAADVDLSAFPPPGVTGNISLDLNHPPPAGTTSVKLSMPVAYQKGGPTVVTADCSVTSPESFRDSTLSTLKSDAAKTKSNSQKDIFAGFDATNPSGASAEGNAEIHLNGILPALGDNVQAGLNLQKSSATNADPKEFDLNLGYHRLGLFVTKELNAALAANNPDQATQALEALQKKFWLGWSLDGTGKIEGEAMNFNVTNAVGDVQLQFISRTASLLKSSFFFRAVPAGVESGVNLRTDSSTVNKDTIARFKSGGNFGVYWTAKNADKALIKKFMIDAEGVDRYLFLNESAINTTTNMPTAVTKGNHYYVEAEAKFYVAETQQGNYAFRVSYIRGGLPPVFSNTKTFQYGFVFESADKK